MSLFYPGPAGPLVRPVLLAAVFFALQVLAPSATPALEWEMMDKFVVDGASTFKSSVTITVPVSQSASLWASTSTVTPHLFVSTSGNVGIRTAAPLGRLDLLAAGPNPTDMAQVWRNSGGVIQGSMSATGVMMAKKFIGDGALLTNISVSGIAGMPALTFGTENSAGSAGTLIRTDAAIAIFDANVPAAPGTAATGSAAFAARRDHVHPLPYGGTANQIYGTNSGATAGEWKAVTVTAAGAVGAVTTLSMNNQLTNSYASAAAVNIAGAGAGITFTGTGPNQIITNNVDLGLMPGTAQVGIGTSAPNYKLDVSGDLRVYGGHLGVGDASPSTVSTIYGSEIFSADTAVYGQRLLTTLSTQTLTAARTHYGSYSRLDNSSDDAGAYNMTLYGSYLTARNVAARTVDSARGVHAFVDNTHASGIITNAYGLVADVGRTAGTITTGYGVYISAIDATNHYGLYQTGGTDINYFAGAVGIGRNPPGGKLDVQASGSAATDMAQIWRNSGGAIVSSMSATGVMMAEKFIGDFIGDGSGLTNLAGASPVNSSLTSANIWIGNSSNLAQARAMSGDAALSNTGVLTLKNTGTAGTYRSVTTDAQGRVSAGTNPTTFAGYVLSDTSANLAAAITDETGTGSLVFSESPALTGAISVNNRFFLTSNGESANAWQRFSMGYGVYWNTAIGSYTITDTAYNRSTFSDENGTLVWAVSAGALSNPQTYAQWHANDVMKLDETGLTLVKIPLYAQAAGSASTDMGQVWYNSGGTIVSSMSATGVMKAVKFIGDGSNLTGVPPSGTAGGVLSGTYPNPSFNTNNTSYPVDNTDGSGLKFWGGSDSYKISMGNTAEYHYGPVTDYSIKTAIDSTAGRGFVWGNTGATPVAGLSNTGNFQVAGTNTSVGEIIGTMGSGYGQFRAVNGNYGAFLRNDGSNTYFLLTASGDQYGTWNTLRPFSVNNATGDMSFVNSGVYMRHSDGNVGIGTTNPGYKLEVDSGANVSFQVQPGASYVSVRANGTEMVRMTP